MAPRDDPFSGANFLVEIDGTTAAGFAEVSGIGVSIDVVLYRNGNDPEQAARKLPGARHYPNVVLKRGFTRDLSLWEWIEATPPDRRDVAILLLDDERNPLLVFRLSAAWPCRWEGPTLHAAGGAIGIETLELAHEGLEVSRAS